MRKTLIAMATVMMIGSAPAFAQDMMSHDGMKKPMKMSASQMKMMKSCQAMSRDKMMKNAGCMKMMKMHPDMMKGDGMMKSGG